MTTYAWTTDLLDKSFSPQFVELGFRTLQGESVSPMNGDIQTVSMPGSRLVWTLSMPRQSWTERRKLQAFLMQLNGREHRIALYDLLRSQPTGTIPTSGVTLNANVAQFATSCNLNTGVAGCTLKAGDWFKIGNQVLMCLADMTANGSGIMNFVPFRFMARAAASSGAAVTLLRPTALFVLDSADIAMGRFLTASNAEPFVFTLVEVFA